MHLGTELRRKGKDDYSSLLDSKVDDHRFLGQVLGERYLLSIDKPSVWLKSTTESVVPVLFLVAG